MTDVAKVLNDAADLIEQRGWSQHSAVGPGGGLCPMAAIFEAAAFYQSRGEVAANALRSHIREEWIAEWNREQPGPEPVIAALRAAAQETGRLPEEET
jgi:hypothetical protein